MIIAKTNTLLRTTKPLQDGRVKPHTRAQEDAHITHAQPTIATGAVSVTSTAGFLQALFTRGFNFFL